MLGAPPHERPNTVAPGERPPLRADPMLAHADRFTHPLPAPSAAV